MSAQTCPAGGPRCTSPTAVMHTSTGPGGCKVAYRECPRCGWISMPFVVREQVAQ